MSKIGRTNYPMREEGGVGEEILPGPVANKIAVSSSSRSAGARTRAVRTETLPMVYEGEKRGKHLVQISLAEVDKN